MLQTHKSRYASANTTSKINNPEFISLVALDVSEKLGRDVTNQEQRYIINYIRNLDPFIYNNTPISNVKSQIAESAFNYIKKHLSCETSHIDIHEILKQEVGVSSERPSLGGYRFSVNQPSLPAYDAFDSLPTKHVKPTGDPQLEVTRVKPTEKLLSQTTLSELRDNVNPQSKIRHNYIVLDSRYRTKSFGPITKFQWNYINNLSRSQGSANTYGTVRDIISIRILPIRIPFISQASNDLERVSISIEELAPQGFVAHENRRFHFLSASVTDVNWIDLYFPDYNDGYYHFDDPVTKLDSFTISFGSPLELLTFDADRAEYTMVYGALFTIVTTNIDHNLTTGDLVYFEDFTTVNPSTDANKIAEINSPSGYNITYINDTSFSIPVVTIGLGIIPPGTAVVVYFGSKRIVIPMELTYFSPE